MRRSLPTLFVVTLVAAATGCATIMHGTGQDVGFSSTPTAAKVTIDNKPVGNAPLIVKLARKDNHIVRMELDGYKPFEATLTRGTSGWVWGNLVFGGLIGLAVDAMTGGLYKITPEQVAGSLAAQSASAGEDRGAETGVSRDGVFVRVVLRPDPSWQRIGTLARE